MSKEKTKKEIYQAYMKLLFNTGKRPSYKEIADEMDRSLSREWIGKLIGEMVEEGFLIKVRHMKNQDILIPTGEMPTDYWMENIEKNN